MAMTEGQRPMRGADILARRGIAAEPAPAASAGRFPDGAHFRIEIPSVEGPAVLRAVVEASGRAGVTVKGGAQGGGGVAARGGGVGRGARLGGGGGLGGFVVRRPAGGVEN